MIRNLVCIVLYVSSAYSQQDNKPSLIDPVQLYCQQLFAQANELVGLGQIDQAMAWYTKLFISASTNTQLLHNMGYACKVKGDFDSAITWYKKALAINPELHDTQLALGMAYLHKGDFENGWKEHSKYLHYSGKNGQALRALLQHNAIAGKTVLLKAEGGFGDTLMMIRYAKLLHESGAYVVASVQKELIPLLSLCPYLTILHPGTDVSRIDAWAPLLSLPAILNVNEHTLCGDIPYLEADKTLCRHWADKLASDTKFKIGICWQASVHNDASRLPVARRGIPLEKLLRVGEIANVSLYSLQQCDGLEALQNKPTVQLHLFDASFDQKHGSFMDTAAVMKQMQLVITVDTAIAHLAGALGVPVILLLAYLPDWRWIAERTTSPWYPTMHIIKQSKPFDWDEVIVQLVEKVRERIISTSPA